MTAPFRQDPRYWRDRVISAVQPITRDILTSRATRWERINRIKSALAAMKTAEEARGVFLLSDGTIVREEA